MKKILSALLVAAMLVATLVVAVMPVAAKNGDGEWSVYAIKSQYLDGYADIMHDVPGYEYTDEGLRMIPATWKDSTPYATFQTTDPVYLKEGVYLQVRVDQFTYDAGDRWFGFSVWDQQNVELGKQGDEYGYGVETLIRIKDGSAFVEGDDSTRAGAKTNLEWYKDLEAGQRNKCTNSTENDKLYEYTFQAVTKEVENESGEKVEETVYCPVLTLKIEWDVDAESYYVYINNCPAPDTYNSALTSYFSERDHMAYIGFSLQNNTMGGTLGCTILKWGTSESNATPPAGNINDKQDVDEWSNEKAPIEDAATVAQGEPAIVLNGVRGESDVAGKPSSVLGNTIVVKDDFSANLLANVDNMANIKYIVDNSVSYDVKDFPVVLLITRNYCTCNYQDLDSDGNVDEECACQEWVNCLALAGNLVQESSSYAARSDSLDYWTPYYVGDDIYHYFTFDWSNIDGLSGRINGLRLDFQGMKGTDPDRNNFDVCELAFFRNIDEAKAYFTAYLDEVIANQGGEDETLPSVGETDTPTEAPTEDAVTEAPTEDAVTEAPTEEATTEAPTEEATTEAPTEEATTEAPTEEATTEAPTEEATTEAPTEEATTEAPTSAPTDDDTTGGKKGCGGVVGVGAIAVVAVVAAGLVSFKKKED